MSQQADRWWKRRPVQVAGALGLVALLVVGALFAWPVVRGIVAPPPNRAPFYLALENLAVAPTVHYTGSLPGGTSWDLRVTSGGEEIGALTTAGQRVDVLGVGGKTYVKLPQSQLPTLPGVPPSELAGRWITGDAGVSGSLPHEPDTPWALASALWTDLGRATDFPRPGAPTVMVGRVPALGVATPSEALFVSASAPYRVLRIVPRKGTGPSPSPVTASTTGSPGRIVTEAARLPAASGEPGPVDFQPVARPDVDQTLGDIQDQTKTLNNAVDAGVAFDIQGKADLACSDAACVVTDNVTSSTTSSSGARVSGTVTASMSATVTVNGEPAGGCSAEQSLPVEGSGSIACDDPGVAPVVAQIRAEKQQEADAEAEATGHDVTIPYTLDFEATTEVYANADIQAEVDKQVGGEQTEQNADDNAPGKGPASCAVGSAQQAYCGLFKSQIEENKFLGDAYRDHIADFLRQMGLKVVTDAQDRKLNTLPTPDGDRVFDMAVWDPNGKFLGYVETKSGDAGLDPRQIPKDQYLQKHSVSITYVFDQLANM